MFSKIWGINIILTTMVVLAAFQAYGIWFGEKKEIPTINPVKKMSSSFEKKMYKKKTIPAANYETVAANNLFAQDRAESTPEEKVKEPDAKPKTDPKLMGIIKKELGKIALYGVIISESEKKALVSNLVMKAPTARTRKVSQRSLNFLKKANRAPKPAVLAPASSGGKQKWVKQGDQIGRFKVMDIKNDSILLSAEGEEFPVSLYAKKGKKNVAPLKKETGPVIVSVEPGAKKVQAPVKKAPTKQAAAIKNIKKILAPIPSASRRPGRSTTPNTN
jgi:type II secretory pathway component PulC